MSEAEKESPEDLPVEPVRMSTPLPEDQEMDSALVSELNEPVESGQTEQGDVPPASEETPEVTAEDDSPLEVNSESGPESTAMPTLDPQLGGIKPLKIDFLFPNGKDGARYQVDDLKNKLFGNYADDVTNYYIEGLEDTGINLDEAHDSLHGPPDISGDGPWELSFTVFYHLLSLPRSRPYRHQANLLINLDPTTLWKNLDSDAELPYWKKDEDNAKIEEDEGVLIAASKRGRSHAHVGSCRDDHFAIRYFHQTGWWLSIVADGAGSAKYSRKGSEIACEKGTELFENWIPKLESVEFKAAIEDWLKETPDAENTLRKSISDVLMLDIAYPSFLEIFNHAKNKGHRVKDYNTTFLITAWKKLETGWFVCSFSIGDGGIAVLEGDKVTPMNLADEGEFSGETVFLTTASAWEDVPGLSDRIYFSQFEDIKGIFAMTDGITDPMFETDHNFSNFAKWEAFLNGLEPAIFDQTNEKTLDEKLLDWMDFWSLGNHDDRTLAIFFPTPPEP